MPDNILAMQFTMMGNYGGIRSTASVITPSTGYVFNAIQCLTDSNISATSNITGFVGTVTITAGNIIYGKFTSVSVSGDAIAYHGKV